MRGLDAEAEAGGSRPHGLLSLVFSGLDLVTKFAFALSAVTLAAIVALYCMEIVCRYFFQAPTIWSRDTIVYLLSGSILLAAPEVARNNSHVAITILVDRCSPVARRRIETALALVAAAVAAGVAWVTLGETLRLQRSGILTDLTVAVPKWWISAFTPLGFSLIGLQYLSLALDPARRGRDRTTI